MKSNATPQASKHAAHPDSGRVRDQVSVLLRSIERFFAALKHKKKFCAASFDAAHAVLQTFVPQAFFACSFAFSAD
ncbi:hypothetical protein [Paraburkholderia terrae]|uniref:hypothetical protein n=1 Tax=Paraburkholderia terrae TaxID=311230 RepID=UPI0033659F20